VHKEREVGGCTSTYAAGHAFTQSTAALLQQSREQCGSSSNRRTAHNCICGGASNDRIRMTTMSLWSVCGSQHRDPVPRCNIHSPHARMSPRYSPFPHTRDFMARHCGRDHGEMAHYRPYGRYIGRHSPYERSGRSRQGLKRVISSRVPA